MTLCLTVSLRCLSCVSSKKKMSQNPVLIIHAGGWHAGGGGV